MNAEHEELVHSWLKYLEAVRAGIDVDDEEVWGRSEELISTKPKVAGEVVLDLLRRADAEDASLIGAGLLRTLLLSSPQLAGWFEEQIAAEERFFLAAQYMSMTGVPLDAQRRVNAALAQRGVDPKFIVEYDEVFEEAD